MRKIFISLLFFSLILSSCSIDLNDEKDKKIAKLQEQIENLKKEKENHLFEKKEKCSSTDLKNLYINIGKNGIFNENGFFYSDLKKSCLWGYRSYKENGNTPIYGIMDIWNNDFIFITDNEMDFNSKTKELKGK